MIVGILEEIEAKKKACLNVVKTEVGLEVMVHIERYKGLCMAEEIIRGHMNNGGWIPTEERLPETSANYLVSSDGAILYCQYSAVHKAFNVYDHFKRWQIKRTKIDVDAWMPMPEPYRPEGSDREEKKANADTEG